MSQLKDNFISEVLPSIQKEFSIESTMCLPKISKICLSMGMGKYGSEVKKINLCANEMTLIAGQKALTTIARKSEAGFKLRQGVTVGVRVTLRRQKMWEFLDRFLNISSPRIRDFRGFSRKGFDAMGNYSCGITEQSIFPEVNLDKMEITQGMNINVVFEKSSPKVSEKVLEMLGFPFQRK